MQSYDEVSSYDCDYRQLQEWICFKQSLILKQTERQEFFKIEIMTDKDGYPCCRCFSYMERKFILLFTYISYIVVPQVVSHTNFDLLWLNYKFIYPSFMDSALAKFQNKCYHSEYCTCGYFTSQEVTDIPLTKFNGSFLTGGCATHAICVIS